VSGAALEPGVQVGALDVAPLNHRFVTTGGVREEECRDLIQAFFRERRGPQRGDPVAATDSDPL
jgi:hypothetical protein